MSKWLALVVLAACGGRTEVMIGVATDLRAPDALDTARLVISRGDTSVVVSQTEWELTGTSEPFNLPGSFGVFSDGDEFLVDVDLQGFKNGGQILSRRARFSLIEDQTLFVRLTLVGGCQDRTDCSASQTCIEGTCQEPDLDSRTFPPFSEELVDTVSCLGGTQLIQTQTGDPMPPTNDAAMCPANLCSEGFCHVDPAGGGGGGRPDGGVDVPVLPPHTYVMDRQLITNQKVLDLNGDGVKDNQFGQVLNIFASQGLDVQGIATSAVNRGESITLINVGTEDFNSANQATFQVLIGDNPVPAACLDGADMTCGRHLDGSGMFDISPNSPVTTPLLGSIVGGVMGAGPGELSLIAVVSAPLQLHLIGARVKLSSISETTLTGTLGGAITMSDMDTKVIPSLVSFYNTQLQADCGTTPPSCGCAPGSNGEAVQSLLDVSPNDCVISVSEFKDNGLIQSILAPDVMINGVSAISYSFDFTAVAGKFQLP